MRTVRKISFVLAALALVPSTASAQGSITGVVRDTSGAVLPGVTVEAASPALIEQVRTAVTDGTGQYRIENLRPGSYTVTFALTGFNTIKREGIELTGSFTATVDSEMRVGALEETITVTGETPTVDVQSTVQQRVMDQAVIDSLPTGRSYNSMVGLVPALISSTNDVGGSRNDLTLNYAVHGSDVNDSRTFMNGVRWTVAGTNGANQTAMPNTSTIQEVVIDYAAVSAEQGEGGVRINLIPKEGGNTFSGVFFGNFTNSSLQSDNFTQDLKNRGLRTPDHIKENWDINPGVGGPIKKDKLWFYTSIRYNGGENFVGGMFFNKNANNPNVWVYEPDTNHQATNRSTWKDAHQRLTWQINPKNKLAGFYDQQRLCLCLSTITATLAPEAARYWYFPNVRIIQAEWTSPLTSRILLEAAVVHHQERYIMDRPRDLSALMINVADQATGLTYRARDTYANIWSPNVFYRAALSYITGRQALKVGFNAGGGETDYHNYDNQNVSYRVNSQSGVPVPNQITLRVMPYDTKMRVNQDLGVFAQDKWTVDRLTATVGIRFEYFSHDFPQQHLGPTPLAPTLELTFPKQPNLRWKDVDPRLGATYDLFGNGKTAVRAALGRYIEGTGAAGPYGANPNPISTLVLTTTRTWNDGNRDFVPNCDLVNPAANGECGGMANANFGKQIPGATWDSDVRTGWRHRLYNWEFSTGVQHEIVPRVAVDVGYFRRWFGNFAVTDNLTVAPSDYTQFSITAPADPRLPGGGGYTIGGLYDLNPSKFGLPANNFVTLSDKYGKQIQHWNGVDITSTARLRGRLTFGGGVSTGKTTADNCQVIAQLPEMLFPPPGSTTRLLGLRDIGGTNLGVEQPGVTPASYCHLETPFLTQGKAYGTYTVPRIGVDVSGVFQSLPGPLIGANYNAPNAVVAPSLGRSLSGNAVNATVNLVAPGTMYGERRNQLDLRLTKIFKFGGRRRTSLNVDIFNVLNANPVLTVNNSFAVWQTPTSILTPRFVRLGAQVDF